ncbi:hypothetical protein ACQYE5_003049 [Enterobacter cancerogenus]
MDSVNGPVYRYLQLRGYALLPVYYQGTGFQLGWEFSTPLYTMTWRQENSVLLICDIQGVQLQQGLESAIGALISLWKDIVASVPEITEIRGLPAEYGTMRECQLRMKMKALLIRQGAREIFIDDSQWLVFP